MSKQHVVPSFYLAEFTLQRSQTGTLWVFDRELRRYWPSTPKKTASDTDFYCGNFDPPLSGYYVEDKLGELETRWAPLVRRIIDTSCLPQDSSNDFADLLAFVAFQAMRVPRTRRQIANLTYAYSKAEALTKLANERLWELFCDHMELIGLPVPVARGELLDYAANGDYAIEADKTWTIQRQITGAIKLMPFLALREWSLFRPEDNAPDFTSSDSPVGVASCQTGSMDRALGYCAAGSVITVPLGRRHALAGFFEGRLDKRLTAREVAGVNAMTAQHARRVMSAEAGFAYLTSNGDLGGAGEFLSA